ncbi:MAG: hypothetical protein ACKPKO_53905, partial [Candidatus Fonsibacter sp.]
SSNFFSAGHTCIYILLGSFVCYDVVFGFNKNTKINIYIKAFKEMPHLCVAFSAQIAELW